jgi:general secretion pathway protein D
MEMAAQTGTNYGISYFQFDKDSNGVGRAGFNGFTNLQDMLNPIGAGGAILGFGNGDKVEIKGPTGTTVATVTSTLGLVNFLKGNTNSNVLSTPQILAMDNEEATIEVGDDVPIGATQAVGTGSTATTTSIQREKATIKLTIKPHISKTDDTLRIELDQQIKALSDKQVKAKNLADSAPVISTRALKSQIVLRDGDTAVLGGLMEDREGESVRKVPLLGDIPILGWLFKGKNTTREKVNLVLFLTPRVIRNRNDRNKLLGDKLKERVDFITTGLGGRDPYGKKMAPFKAKAARTSTEKEFRPKSDDSVE